MKIVLVLPAYNEERDLPGLLERIEQALAGWADYHVLVIDDGSKDQTAQIARQAADVMPVALIQHPKNLGLGGAVRTGLKSAAHLNCDVIVTLDADNSQPPELIRDLIEPIRQQSADLVIASRFQPGAREIGVPPFRVFLSHAAGTILRTILRFPGARDYTCGFRAYRASLVRDLIARFGDNLARENSFACMLEVLINCCRLGARVSEVPMQLRYDKKLGASKMRVVQTSIRYAVTIVRAFGAVKHRPEDPDIASIYRRALAAESPYDEH